SKRVWLTLPEASTASTRRMSVVGSAWVCAGAGAIKASHTMAMERNFGIAGQGALFAWRGPEGVGIGDQRGADRLGLLDDHRMGRIRNDHDGDAVAQRAPVFFGVFHVRQRVVARLDIEHRRPARRIV